MGSTLEHFPGYWVQPSSAQCAFVKRKANPKKSRKKNRGEQIALLVGETVAYA
jgi:hypothetical protein